MIVNLQPNPSLNPDNTPTVRMLLRDPVLLLAFGFGSGLAPKAPGTAGTLAAVPLWLMIALIPQVAQFLLVAVVIVVGIPICGIAARSLGVHDHGGIVWDEFAGLFLTLLLLPAGPGPEWVWLLIGFVLFRAFDILKPWPIRWLDRHVPGGTGIMLDDLLAALFAVGAGYGLSALFTYLL